MKKLIPFVSICIFSYLLAMNSTENRQLLTDDNENASYVLFRNSYREKTGDTNDYVMARCYTAYQGLVHMRSTSASSDTVVKDRLVKMGLCDLDDGILVLKGFHIEDSLSVLVGSPRRIGKK